MNLMKVVYINNITTTTINIIMEDFTMIINIVFAFFFCVLLIVIYLFRVQLKDLKRSVSFMGSSINELQKKPTATTNQVVQEEAKPVNELKNETIETKIIYYDTTKDSNMLLCDSINEHVKVSIDCITDNQKSFCIIQVPKIKIVVPENAKHIYLSKGLNETKNPITFINCLDKTRNTQIISAKNNNVEFFMKVNIDKRGVIKMKIPRDKIIYTDVLVIKPFKLFVCVNR